MITSKRDLKKYINRVCTEISEAILPAAVLTKHITDEKAQEILGKLSEYQAQAISRLNISFDKTPDAFESARAYHAAKTAYYREAYAKLTAEFEKGASELISSVNKA